MSFWDADLTTRLGAESATDSAGTACFAIAVFRIIAALFFGGMIGLETLEGKLIAGVTALEAVLALAAGFRFRAGKGAFIGIAVAAMLVLAIVNSLVTLAFLGIILNSVFLVMVIQGIRGAFALRKGQFDEDDYAAFE